MADLNDAVAQEPVDSEYAAPLPDYSYAGAPMYAKAADLHNIASGGESNSWFAPSSVGKFTAAAAISGVGGLINTGITISNWLGTDAKQVDLGNVMMNLDSNLGNYYQQHKESADMAGFIAASIVPGTLGVKILRYGQAAIRGLELEGVAGSGLLKSFGLLPDAAASYLTQSEAAVAASQTGVKLFNQYTVKAIAAGFGQQALEAGAFEIFSTAALAKSPVLEDQDFKSLAMNMGMGMVLGGAIGGALEAVGLVGKLKKAVGAIDLREKPFTGLDATLGTGADTSEQMIAARYSRDNLLGTASPANASVEEAAKLGAIRDQTVSKLDNTVRKGFQDLTGGNAELANPLADMTHTLTGDQVYNNLAHAVEIKPLNVVSAAEKEINQIVKAGGDVQTAKLGQSYIRILGDDAGSVTDSAPAVLRPIDDAGSVKQLQADIKAEKFTPGAAVDYSKAATSSDIMSLQRRNLWADTVKEVDWSKVKSVSKNDIGMLSRAYKDGVSVPVEMGVKKSNIQILGGDQLFNHIADTTDKIAQRLLSKTVQGEARFNTDQIAAALNVRPGYLTRNDVLPNLKDNFFDLQKLRETYTAQQIQRGLWSQAKGLIPTENIPTAAKVVYKTGQTLVDNEGNVMRGMADIAARQKLREQTMDNAFAGMDMPSDAKDLIMNQAPRLGTKDIYGATRLGGGPGLASFSMGGYNSLKASVEWLGSITSRLKKTLGQEVEDIASPSMLKLGQNQKAAIELSVINQRLAGQSERMVPLFADKNAMHSQVLSALTDADSTVGARTMLARDKYDALVKAIEGNDPEKLSELVSAIGKESLLNVQNPETWEAIRAHVQINDAHNARFNAMNAAQGMKNARALENYYPIKPNPKDYPHFAFVVDPSVTGSGHVTMLHAASAGQLENLINSVRALPDNFKVLTRADTEEWHKAFGDYNYDRALNDNYIQTTLASKGINSQFFAQSDPQRIVSDFMDFHSRRATTLARELISAKNDVAFQEIRRLAEVSGTYETAKYGSISRLAESAAKNPYTDYLRTALDVSNRMEFPLLNSVNNALEGKFSELTGKAFDLLKKAKTPDEIAAINDSLKEYGAKSAYGDAATELYANHPAGGASLSKFIRFNNSILSTFTLGLDFLNGAVNALGANVLRGSEVSSVIRAIRNSNPEIAGKLAGLMDASIDGLPVTVPSASKLYASAMRDYFGANKQELLEQFQKHGWVKSTTDQFGTLLDNMALTGTESASELGAKTQKIMNALDAFRAKGAKLTGNEAFEQFNRFVSANAAKKISDLGVQSGIMTAQDQMSFINSFVNRVEGNTLASQRPMMFQGPLGQAIGLFQTYQFNMMQNLFRYVAEGDKKSAAMALGLQSTIFGLNGAPAFQVLNNHIIGTMSGNPNHRDLYDTVYGAAGKAVGDTILYGLPSKIFDTALYSRGDINPRYLTVVPSSLKDIPMVSMYSHVLGTLWDAAGKMANGGEFKESVLQAVEHNGISRPLAGLAQISRGLLDGGEVKSVTGKGTLVGHNDLLSLASLSRLAGGKPLDESVLQDEVYRISAYATQDGDRRKALGEAAKTFAIDGQYPDDIGKMAERYAAAGGKQKDFNKWMVNQYKSANTSQAELIRNKLDSPYSQKVQILMGSEQ